MSRKPVESVMAEGQVSTFTQARLAEAVFNDPLVCTAILDQHYNFIRVNEAYMRATRKNISEFAGRNHFDLYPNGSKPIFDEVVRTRRPRVTSAHPFMFLDQPERGVTYWDWSLAPVLDEQGEIEYLVSSAVDVSARTRAADELRQHSRLVLEARDSERRRIARELHDGVSQELGGVLALLASIRESRQLDGRPAENLKTAMAATEQCLQEIRDTSHLLHPPALDERGLRGSLVWFVSQFRRTTGIAVDLKLPPALRGLPRDVEEAIFRIVQEALNNVAKHSQSSRAKLELVEDPSRVTLKIVDQGRGMAPTASVRDKKTYAQGGIGIPAIRERAVQLGGKCEIASSPRGTALCITLPRPKI